MSLNAETFTGSRFAAATVGSDGRPVHGAASPFSFAGDAQPVRGEELANELGLPRTRKAWWLYTETELRTADEAAGTPADRVTIAGDLCEVYAVEDWNRPGLASNLAHFRVLCIRKEALP